VTLNTRLFRAMAARHDIVHRNGKSKDGDMVSMGMANVDALIHDLLDLAEDVETGLLTQSP